MLPSRYYGYLMPLQRAQLNIGTARHCAAADYGRRRTFNIYVTMFIV